MLQSEGRLRFPERPGRAGPTFACALGMRSLTALALTLVLLSSGCASRSQGVAHMVIGAALVGVGAAVGASDDSSSCVDSEVECWDLPGAEIVAAPLVLGGGLWFLGGLATVIAHTATSTQPEPAVVAARPSSPAALERDAARAVTAARADDCATAARLVAAVRASDPALAASVVASEPALEDCL